MKTKSLRQLAKEIGVSASYLSQVKNGKRPASHKVLSKIDTKVLSSVKQNRVDTRTCANYNENVLGNRLVVGRRTLDP